MLAIKYILRVRSICPHDFDSSIATKTSLSECHSENKQYKALALHCIHKHTCFYTLNTCIHDVVSFVPQQRAHQQTYRQRWSRISRRMRIVAAHQPILPQQSGRQAGMAGAIQHSASRSAEMPQMPAGDGLPLSGVCAASGCRAQFSSHSVRVCLQERPVLGAQLLEVSVSICVVTISKTSDCSFHFTDLLWCSAVSCLASMRSTVKWRPTRMFVRKPFRPLSAFVWFAEFAPHSIVPNARRWATAVPTISESTGRVVTRPTARIPAL